MRVVGAYSLRLDGARYDVRLGVRVRRRRDRAGRARRRADGGQQRDDLRIDRGQLIVRPRQIEHVPRPDLAGHVVAEQAQLRVLAEDRPGASRFVRQIELLVVEEEERLVAHDRPADAAAELVHGHVVPRQVVDLVEVVVRVQLRSPPVVIDAAVELVRARPRDERHLHRPLRAAGGVGRGAGHGDFFDRVQTREHLRVETVRGLQVVADPDPVEREVDGVLRQAVDRRVAVVAGLLHAGQEHHRAQSRCARRAAAS